MPLAVRISVSMCSLMTGARAGSSEASSASVAARQAVRCACAIGAKLKHAINHSKRIFMS